MATITKGYTFGATEQVTNTKLHSLVDDATISGIVNADITDGTITEAKLDINNAPTDGYYLKYNGTAGKPEWATLDLTSIKDTDEDTQIQTEETSDEDIIRFDIAGTEVLVIGDGTNEELVKITNAGTNSGLYISQDGIPAAGKNGLYVYSNAVLSGGALARFEVANSSAGNYALEVDYSGTSYAVSLTSRTGGNPILHINNLTSDDSIYDDSGAKLTAAGVWTDASGRSQKENFETLDTADVLSKIEQLEVSRYNYKKKKDEKHISPMADDFPALFGIGDGKSLSAKDIAGVALLGIKELIKRVKALEGVK